MPPYKNVSGAPRDIASGRVLAPGEIAEDGVDPDNAHDAALIEDESLIPCDPAPAEEDGVLRGKALEARAEELDIEGRSAMKADELREAVAAAEAALADNDQEAK